MDISDVAKQSGVPASTLRFYEEKGLITSTGRHGLKRTFGPHVLERLALIALGRAAGFTLDEIGSMFTPDGRPQINRQALFAKATELDSTIMKLTAMRDGLRHAAVCKAPSHLECPKFRQLLNVAAASVKSAAKSGGRKRPSTQQTLGRTAIQPARRKAS